MTAEKQHSFPGFRSKCVPWLIILHCFMFLSLCFHNIILIDSVQHHSRGDFLSSFRLWVQIHCYRFLVKFLSTITLKFLYTVFLELDCTYCNFLSAHINYMDMLSAVLLSDLWPRSFCFIGPAHHYNFLFCVVHIKHNITDCDYFHCFLKEKVKCEEGTRGI